MPEENQTKKLLTVDEKILLHLFELPPTDDHIVPLDFTQEGIAKSIGIRLNHVSRAVKNLQSKGYLREIKTHVYGELRMRKVYFLTEEGYSTTQNIKDKLVDYFVLVKDSSGEERHVKLKEVNDYLHKKMPLLEILRLIEEEGIIDAGRPVEKEEAPEREAAVFFNRKPKPESFYGRDEEIQNIRKWLESIESRIMILHGPKGIGKSALAFKVIEDPGVENNIFWFTIENWDLIGDVLKDLSNFMVNLGKLKLLEYVKTTTTPNLKEIAHVLEDGLRESNSVLVFDNIQNANRDIMELLSYSIRMFENLPGAKLMIMCRDPNVLMQERRPAEKTFLMLELGGLDRNSSRSLVDPKVNDEEFDRIFKLVEGNPLYLKQIDVEKLKPEEEGEFTSDELALLKYLKVSGKK